jgi:hypothetical protein
VRILAILLTMFIVGCVEPQTRQQRLVEISKVVSPANRLKIVDGPLDVSHGEMWIVQDVKTKQEFVTFLTHDGASICAFPTVRPHD